MVLFYLVIIVLIFYSIKYNKKGIWLDYIDKAQCNAIKGIFILVVFMRHVLPYVNNSGYEMLSIPDRLFTIINSSIGQLLVVMFLFYSGYGVAESVKKKGQSYINGMPRKRVLSTLVNFDVAVCMFAIMNLFIGINFTANHFLLSLIGWESIGNSNWYIFDILVCYILCYLFFKVNPKTEGWAISLLTVLFVSAVVIMSFYKMKWWYNTILCFPAGMMYSQYKTQLESFIFKKYWSVLGVIGVLFSLTHIAALLGFLGSYFYNIDAILFALLIVILTMKLKINNSILCWLGANLFPFYIYQRIPMVALSNLSGETWVCNHAYLYIVICFFLTVGISACYRYWRIMIK